MRLIYFTEQPYPDAWDQPFVRVDIPNIHCDPEVAGRLYNRYLDEYVLADELGYDLMVNEHHSTATCMVPSVNLMLGILARQTRRARLIALGVPIANRPDPLRIAEELSMVDVISGGRLEMGFVKGVPYEIPIANLNPVRMMDRFWEAHDLILQAMRTTSGPFAWQGEYFNYRSINIWPRPLQTPNPPVWITSLSPSSAPGIAERGYVVATVLGGVGLTKALFDSYRDASAKLGRPVPARDRFAYAGLAAVGTSEAEGRRRGAMVQAYLTGIRTRPQFSLPPGYFSTDVVAKVLKPSDASGGGGPFAKFAALGKASLDELIADGIMFCGTPDQVYDQIVAFDEKVGGIGNMVLMAQGGHLGHQDTVESITLFAKEVTPRLQDRFGSGIDRRQAAGIAS